MSIQQRLDSLLSLMTDADKSALANFTEEHIKNPKIVRINSVLLEAMGEYETKDDAGLVSAIHGVGESYPAAFNEFGWLAWLHSEISKRCSAELKAGRDSLKTKEPIDRT